jgi:hypothetical protein
VESEEAIWDCIDGAGIQYCEPWLCRLDWDKETIAFEGTVMEGDELKVCVTVHRTPHELGLNDALEYQVLFYFDSQCKLIRAIMGAEQNGTRAISDLTIENTLASNIHNKLETIVFQCPNACKVCNDPSCTDESHDHSGINCTDKNCTNSTHHHNDEHHDDKHHH